jgi:hypothetical protein
VGAGDLTDAPAAPVSVDTVFDRFPASVRGAVVVRALDPEPHQIRLVEVEVAEAHDPGRVVHSLGVDDVTVDVAPHREVLIPFDVPFSDLGPGWYCVVAEVEVDGALRMRGPDGGGKRFVVPWPAVEVRRADLRPDLTIRAARGVEATIDRVELKADRAIIRWHHAPGDDPVLRELRVTAGRRRLHVVESSYDANTGVRTTVTHPAPKSAPELTIEVSQAGRGSGRATATLDLPS